MGFLSSAATARSIPGLLRERGEPHAPRAASLAEIPFSRISGRGRVGPDFFRRMGLIPEVERAPAGVFEDWNIFRRTDFDPAEIHPAIRRFYAQTGAYRLFVRARWSAGFRLPGRAARLYTRWLGQLNLPPDGEHEIDSRIHPVRDLSDGRCGARAWVRTYVQTGEALYVATYAHHRRDGCVYMNIAFPVPGGSVASIRRLEAIPGDAGGRGLLSTTVRGAAGGQEGFYYANRCRPIRLPIVDVLRLWPGGSAAEDLGMPPAGGEGAPVVARQEVRFCGLRFLTLDYWLVLVRAPRAPERPAGQEYEAPAR